MYTFGRVGTAVEVVYHAVAVSIDGATYRVDNDTLGGTGALVVAVVHTILIIVEVATITTYELFFLQTGALGSEEVDVGIRTTVATAEYAVVVGVVGEAAQVERHTGLDVDHLSAVGGDDSSDVAVVVGIAHASPAQRDIIYDEVSIDSAHAEVESKAEVCASTIDKRVAYSGFEPVERAEIGSESYFVAHVPIVEFEIVDYAKRYFVF